MDDDAELLPCPFCGCSAVQDFKKAQLLWHPDHTSCPLSATYFDREHWNTRIASRLEADEDDVERLVREFESIQGYRGLEHERMARAAILAMRRAAQE